MSFQITVAGQKAFSEPHEATVSSAPANPHARFFAVLKTWP